MSSCILQLGCTQPRFCLGLLGAWVTGEALVCMQELHQTQQATGTSRSHGDAR